MGRIFIRGRSAPKTLSSWFLRTKEIPQLVSEHIWRCRAHEVKICQNASFESATAGVSNLLSSKLWHVTWGLMQHKCQEVHYCKEVRGPWEDCQKGAHILIALALLHAAICLAPSIIDGILFEQSSLRRFAFCSTWLTNKKCITDRFRQGIQLDRIDILKAGMLIARRSVRARFVSSMKKHGKRSWFNSEGIYCFFGSVIDQLIMTLLPQQNSFTAEHGMRSNASCLSHTNVCIHPYQGSYITFLLLLFGSSVCVLRYVKMLPKTFT